MDYANSHNTTPVDVSLELNKEGACVNGVDVKETIFGGKIFKRPLLLASKGSHRIPDYKRLVSIDLPRGLVTTSFAPIMNS
jgi:hypothetical protein